MSERVRRLPMQPEEICRSYRQAASPADQIEILAQLNAAEPEEIEQVLRESGIELPARPVTGRWSTGDETRLRELLDAGWGIDQIAAELHRTRKAVAKKIDRMHQCERQQGTPGKAEQTELIPGVSDTLLEQLPCERVLTLDELVELQYQAITDYLTCPEARLTDMLTTLSLRMMRYFLYGKET